MERDEIEIPKHVALEDAHAALATLRAIAADLRSVARGLRDFGSERAADRVGMCADELVPLERVLDRYVGQQVYERLHDAQQATTNMMLATLAGIKIGDKAKSA